MKNLIFTTHRSILDIPQKKWDKFVDNSRISIQYNHLKAIELSKVNQHIPGYITIYDTLSEKYIGIAYYVVIDMDMSKSADEIAPEVLSTIKEWYPNFLNMRMLECGLLTGIGKAYSIDPEFEEQALPQLLEKIDNDAKEQNADFVLIRDLDNESYTSGLSHFQERNYSPLNGYASAVMHHNFTSFEDYLSKLKGKRRSDIKSSKRKLNQPGITVQKLEDYGSKSQTLTNLWEKVHENSDSYSHEELTPQYFKSLEQHLKSNTDVFVIKHCDRIIATALCFEGEEEYFLGFVGFDTDYNRQYDLYFNMYYICMEEGFRKGKKLNMGLTTYDVKSKLGCTMAPNIYFMKNMKYEKESYSLAHFFEESIELPKKPHEVFKAGIESGAVEYDKVEFPSPTEGDIFGRVDSYHRMNLLRFMKCYNLYPPFQSAQQATVQYNGRELGMFGSNSYLCYANDSRVKDAAKDAVDKYGTGCSGSPLLNGTLDLHVQLCNELKNMFKKEACITYSTGYQANLGVIGALAKSSDLIILDEFSHASLIDGALFSKAKIARYRHNNLAYLDKLLSRFEEKQKLVIADSIFSMEGTVVDLPELVRVCKKHNARLVLDEAHAVGVYGPTGAGVAEYFGLTDEIDIITGTFSKSCASVGGFAVASEKIVDFLRHNSRPHMFSASLPPASVATALKALQLIRSSSDRRVQVVENARRLAKGLIELGYEVNYQDTAIVPVYCRDEVLTMVIFKKLFDMGIYVNPVIHPAVPKKGELLRLSCMSTHTEKDIDKVIAVFKAIKTEHFPCSTESISIHESNTATA